MSYGEIEYNPQGLPKCELCGQYYNRVLTHVRQKHAMTEREYKQMFGFDLIKGIISDVSKEKSRKAVLNNYDVVVLKNLLDKGNKTRFIAGNEGRTKSMVSAQTKQALKDRLKTPCMQKFLQASGQKVGLSGLGNKTRWSN